MSDDYLWDRCGPPDPAVAHFERWAGMFAVSRAPEAELAMQRRGSSSRQIAAFAICAAAAVLAWRWLGRDASNAAAFPGADTGDRPQPAVIARPTPPHVRLLLRSHPMGLPSTPPPPSAERPARARGAHGAKLRPRTAEATVIEPTLSAASQRQAVVYTRQVARCFRAAASAPTGAMLIMAAWVERDGSISEPTLVQHTFDDGAVGEAAGSCIAGVMRSWRLPASERRIRLQVPFVDEAKEQTP